MKNRAYLIALTAIAAAGATWFYESREIDRQINSLAAEQNHISRLQQHLSELQQQRDEAFRAAAEAERELQSRPPAADTATPTDTVRIAQTKAWLARLKRLRQSFAADTAQSIPELKLLTELDWLNLARTLSADSELDLRKARSTARALAVKRFTPSLGTALRGYTAANDGNLPTDCAQLLPYFKTPVDPNLLQRYAMTTSGNIRTMKGEALGERAPVDDDFDPRHSVSVAGSTSFSDSWAESLYQRSALQAVGDFASANPGQTPKTAADVLPYVRNETVRPIVEARARFEQDHQARVSSYQQLRPYVKDAASGAFLEKLIAAEQKSAAR